MIGETILHYKIIEKLGEVRLVPINRDGRDRVQFINQIGKIYYDWPDCTAL